MTKKRLAVDFDLASQNLELIDATQGASRVHITWSGVDLARPNSSLLNITFYDNAGSIVKVCGGKPQIQLRIPKSLKYALGTQVLTADDISVIFIKIKRMLDTHPIDNTAVVQVELPNSDQSRSALALKKGTTLSVTAIFVHLLLRDFFFTIKPGRGGIDNAGCSLNKGISLRAQNAPESLAVIPLPHSDRCLGQLK